MKISRNVRQDMTSEGRGSKWNGEVTGIRPKKNGGLGVLPVNCSEQWRKTGKGLGLGLAKGVRKQVGMGGKMCQLSDWMKNE